MRRMLSALLGSLLGIGAAFAVWTEVRGSAGAAALPTVVPYSGRIERDGTAWSGDVDLRFQLYDASANLVWTEDWLAADGHAVSVHDGRFEALLGSYQTSLASALAAGDALYLTVSVRRSAADSWVTLEGSKPFRATAYALWTAASGSLVVHGDLTVTGATTLSGDTHVGSLEMAHDVAKVYMGIDSSGNEKNGDWAVCFGDDNSADGAQLDYRSTADALSFEKNFQNNDTADLLTISTASATAGAMTLAGPATVTGKLTSEGPLQLKSGADMVLSSGSRVLLSGTTGDDTFTWKTSSGTKLTWTYSAANNELKLANGSTNLLTIQSDGDASTDLTTTVQTNGKAWIAGTLSKSGQVDLEVDAADKLYVGDSSCSEGALKGGTIDGTAALCACFSSTPSGGDNQGHGWYCID